MTYPTKINTIRGAMKMDAADNDIPEVRDPETGRFLQGNSFWRHRSTHGANPTFENPQDLWDACTQYFERVETNPLLENKLIPFQGKAGHEPVRKMRAMTIGAICLFLDIDETTWRNWSNTRPDLSPIITRAEAIIFAQKFEGAAAGLLNPNIIARDLGLADKREHSGADGKALIPKPLSNIEAARRIAFVLALGMNDLENKKIADEKSNKETSKWDTRQIITPRQRPRWSMTRLSRTYLAQMDALKKYRAKARQVVRVERVTVNDSGQAIVGPVTHGGTGW